MRAVASVYLITNHPKAATTVKPDHHLLVKEKKKNPPDVTT